MTSSALRKIVPMLAALVLLLLGLRGLLAPWPQPAEPIDAAATALLADRLQAGQIRGYPELLRRAQGESTLHLRLLDLDGQALAEWPPALTQSQWGPLAGGFQRVREAFWQLIGRQDVVTLLAGSGRPVGELAVVRLRGTAGALGQRLPAVLLSLLGTWALLLSRHTVRAPAAASPGVAKKATRGTVERLGLRLGPALEGASLGLVMLDAQQRIRYINGAALELSGRNRDEALGLPVYSVLRVEHQGDKVDGNPFSFEGHQPASERLPLRLLGRRGEEHAVDATILRLRRRGADWGGMLVLLDGRDDQVQAQTELQREAQLAETALDALSDGIAVCDRYGRILRVNRRLNRLFAYAEGELEGLSIAKLLPVPFLNEPSVTLDHYLGERQEGRPKVVGWRKNATNFPVDLRVEELEDSEFRYLLLISDSSERQRQDNLSMRLGRLLDYAAEEIYIFDAHSLYFTEVNREARDNLGYSQEQLGRMTPLHIAPSLDREALDLDLNALRNGERRQVAYRTEHRRANGTLYPVSLRMSYSPEEEPPVFMALAQDITEQRAAEMRLEFMAHNDVLTSLPNRAALTAHLDHLLRLPPSEGQVSLFFLDLDHFKQINDRFGHAIGDAVLVSFTQRIREQLPADHFLARLSGDEFVIAALGTDRFDVEQTANDILEAMRPPIDTPAGEMSVGVCIGIAHRLVEDSYSSLMQRADEAMYQAKARGGQCYVLAAVPPGQDQAGAVG